jgi:hypothetical protein
MLFKSCILRVRVFVKVKQWEEFVIYDISLKFEVHLVSLVITRGANAFPQIRIHKGIETQDCHWKFLFYFFINA